MLKTSSYSLKSTRGWCALLFHGFRPRLSLGGNHVGNPVASDDGMTKFNREPEKYATT